MGKRLIGSVGLKPGTDTGFDLDEKGQIHGYSDTQFALPVGDDNQVLTSLASEASGLKWADSQGLTSPLSADLDFNGNNILDPAQTERGESTATISSGTLAVTTDHTRVATEGGASTDDVTQITQEVGGEILTFRSNNHLQDPTFKDTGNILMAGDFTLDTNQDTFCCVEDSGLASPMEISRSNNA